MLSMLRSRRVNLVLICLALGSALSCAAIGRLNILTTEQEVAIGSKVAQEVESEVKLYNDPIVVAYIDGLGQALVRHSKRSDIQYHFQVVDTSQVNAFALPGGWIYVNRGLITTAENESELTSVMAHEIAHVVARHGARQITKQFGLAVLIRLATGESENRSLEREIAETFMGIGAGLTLLRYSREAEREADQLAVEEMYAAGMDPNGMVTFFEKLLAVHTSEPSGAAVWLSTHPPTQERIADIRAAIKTLPPKPHLQVDSERFQKIKARILKCQATVH